MMERPNENSKSILFVLDEGSIKGRDKNFLNLEDENPGMEILSPEDARKRGFTTHDGSPFIVQSLYYQNPFCRSIFCPEESAPIYFSSQYFQRLIALMQNLGASQIKIHEVRALSNKNAASFHSSAEVTLEGGTTIRGHLELNNDEKEVVASWLQTEVKATGLTSKKIKDLDIESLLGELSATPDVGLFKNLAEARKGPNPPFSLKREIGLNSSYSSIIKLAAGLKIPGIFGSKAGGAFKQEKEKHFSVTFEVEFPKETND
jgi:hypothetical protein